MVPVGWRGLDLLVPSLRWEGSWSCDPGWSQGQRSTIRIGGPGYMSGTRLGSICLGRVCLNGRGPGDTTKGLSQD